MIAMVTGANGQLGRSFIKVAKQYPEITFHYYKREKLDITSRAAVLAEANLICPDFIVNCAAYTEVDKAESDQELAYAINETAVGYLAEAAKEVGATLVHYSSDYVYNIDSDKPLLELDATNAQGIYAKSKLAGEKKIAEVDCKAIIIRTSWVYSEFGNNFVKTMLRLGGERDHISVVDDQVGCPTYATDIAVDTIEMMSQYTYISEHQLTINYAGYGQISWYDFAVQIFSERNIEIEVTPISTAEYPTPALRPLWSVMDLTLLKDTFDIDPKDWKASLATCLICLAEPL